MLLNLPLIFVLLVLRMRPQTYVPPEETPVDSLKGGIRFLRDNRLILSSITLDMFAVLFGGATYLLPVFAKDILHVDATGLGFLRAAPSVGALVMVIIARRPPFTQAGRALLWAVAGFGVATIVFGFSTNFWLSMAMMFTLGALDNISVVVRHTLVLVFTPDDMRGRVGAVNSMFIGASNELGGFESGFTAAAFGPVGAVVLGGLGTLAVVAAIAHFSPELRGLTRLSPLDVTPETDINPSPEALSPQPGVGGF
ncbi:MAG: MFS transporter [Anaerolineae bacterium]